MALTFPTQKATQVDRINSAIIFGEYGTGKTWLAASANQIADYAPTLLVDIEGSAAGVGRRYPDVDIVQASSYNDLEVIKHELLTEKHDYGCVIFDTLNVAQKRAKAKLKADFPNNSFAMWDALSEWSLDFVRSMHHAPFLTIFTAHPQTEKDDATGRLTTTLKLAGGARSEVPTVPDLIGYTFNTTNDEGQRVRAVQVDGTSAVVAKNRFGLPEIIYPSAGQTGVTISDIQAEIICAQKEGR